MKARYKVPTLSQRETEAVYRYVGDDVARNAIAAVLTVLHLRKWSKAQINKLYDDVIAVLDRPPVLGKYLMSGDVKAFHTEKYGIDWERVHIKFEVDENK